MVSKALRLHGKEDLRLDEITLPAIKDDEILCKVVSDSICMSSYKAALQGAEHKRVPENVAEHPVIIGHELCGEIVEVGKKWQDKFKPGQKFAVQPALNYQGTMDAIGYSFEYAGGCATYIILPHQCMEMDCLLPYDGDAFFYGSLAEPISCIIGAFNAQYHCPYKGRYDHVMGIKPGGNLIILAGAGPMGLGAVDYAINGPIKPATVTVTDINNARLARAASILSPEAAAKKGVALHYVNTAEIENPEEYLVSLTGGVGYDDVFIFAPVRPVVEMANKILNYDACINFFAGPTDHNFSAMFNFYNVHYNSVHVMGTSGGNKDDLVQALHYMSRGLINPSSMITHIGGLDSAAHTTLNLPNIPGGKKLIYTHISMELTAIEDFEEKGKTDPMFKALAEIVARNNGLWCAEAERYLLSHAKPI